MTISSEQTPGSQCQGEATPPLALGTDMGVCRHHHNSNKEEKYNLALFVKI